MYRFHFNDIGVSRTEVMQLLAFLAIAVLLSLVFRTLIMLAVNYDAKAIGIKNKTVWCVLTFLFPIVGLIYLAARSSLEKTVPRMCVSCGETMPPNTRLCVKCGSAMLLDYKVTKEAEYKKWRRAMLIAGLGVFVVLFVWVQVLTLKTSYDLIRRSREYANNNGGYNDYSDYFDSFGDYFQEHGQAEEPPTDNGDNDFFDDFNNFGADGEDQDDSGSNSGGDDFSGDPFGFFDELP